MERRKKKETEFFQDCRDKGITPLGSYYNNVTHIMGVCSQGHELSILPRGFKSRRYGCYKCSKKCDQAKEEFYQKLSESGYTLLSDYVDNQTHVEMTCLKGHKVRITPNNFKRGKRCNNCSNGIDDAHETFNIMAELRGDRIVGEYLGATKKVNMICGQGHEFKTTPHSYRMGSGCPSCAKYGFNYESKAYLYVLKSICGVFMKVGITKDIKTRLRRLKRATPFPVFLVGLFEYEKGVAVRELEQEIHNTLMSAEFRGFEGATEWCYYCDEVLLLPPKRGFSVIMRKSEYVLGQERKNHV